ncbi:MAG TPA: PEGA domain-containing protein [Vicinamibacterales bacterium]|nr:PEGA domain-containing protein [Vicinamibacterales bacterium]
MKTGSFAALPLVLLTMASVAGAQQSPPPPRSPGPAALAIPDPFTALRPGDRDLYQSPDRLDRFQQLSPPHPPPPVFLPGVYVPGPYYIPLAGVSGYQASVTAVPHVMISRGGLALETLPDHAQVFVDGFYVGLAEGFGMRGRALDLSAGSHRIELRAPGYETLSFSVWIAPNEILRYRGDMQARSPKQTVLIVPPQPAVSKSVYVIRNCYAGNKPPDGALPKGCERRNLKVRSKK